MSDELKPCPFCGGSATIGGLVPWAECAECAATGEACADEASAAAAWNRRVDPQPPAEAQPAAVDEAMTSNVELLPLPEEECMGGNDVYGVEYPLYTSDHMQSYARANVAHATAAKDAEIEALKAEREVIGAEAVKYADKSGRLEAKVERLAEAGQAMRDNLRCVLRVNCNCDDGFIDRQTAEWDAALRDRDQEGKDG